eukprot:1232480-Prymnesium_polylepis.1
MRRDVAAKAALKRTIELHENAVLALVFTLNLHGTDEALLLPGASLRFPEIPRSASLALGRSALGFAKKEMLGSCLGMLRTSRDD